MISCATLALITFFAAPGAATMPTQISYGKPFAVVMPIRLPDLAKKAEGLLGNKIQVFGPIHRVCTKKGCWMSLKDGDASLRVSFKDYSFFMPTSLPAGTITVLKGVLSKHKLSEAQAAHLEKEGGNAPENGEELRLVAEGALVEYSDR
jgi:hypothetical protein